MDEDPFDELLAEYDEALAKGSDLVDPATLEDPVLRERLLKAQACLDQLEAVFPRRPVVGSDSLAAASVLSALFPQPTMIGRFEIRRELGRGGHGVVFLAYDTVLKREVALKVPRPEILQNADMRLRFRREAEAAARLEHPNLIPLYETGEIGPVCYLVSAFCPGPNLATWLSCQTTSVAPETAIRLVAPLADAIGYMHGLGILHRDIKPGNVILQFSNIDHGESVTAASGFPPAVQAVPKITDFGLAHFAEESTQRTRTGAIVGTPGYMSPEQAEGNPAHVGPPTDVYSLGVMLYTILIGRPPFLGTTDLETLRRILVEDPVSPRRLRSDVSRDLETVILKCLEKSPQHRYSSAAALADDLNSLLAGNPIRARRQSVIQKACRWSHRHRAGIAVLALFIAVLGTTGAGSAWLMYRLTEAQSIQERIQQQLEDQRIELVQTVDYSKSAQETLQQFQADSSGKTAAARRRQLYCEQIQQIAHLPAHQGYTAIQKLRDVFAKKEEKDPIGFEWYYLMQSFGGDAAPIKSLDHEMVGAIHVSSEGHSFFVSLNDKLDEYDLETGKFLRRIEDCRGVHILGFVLDPKTKTGVIQVAYQQRNAYGKPQKRNTSAHYSLMELASVAHTRLRATSDLKEFFSARIVQSPSGNSGYFRYEISRHELATGNASRISEVQGFSFDNFLIDPADLSVIWNTGDAIRVMRGDIEKQQIPFERNDFVLLAISPDGRYLAISTELNGVMVWQKSETGNWLPTNPLPKPPNFGAPERTAKRSTVGAVTFTSSGDQIYSAHNQELHVTDLVRRQVTGSLSGLPGRGVGHLDVVPDGHTSVWATDAMMGLWRPVKDVPQIDGHPQSAWSVAYSSDGLKLVTGGGDESIRLWDTATGRQTTESSRQRSTVTSAIYSPDGKRLASAGLDGTVCIWDAPTLKYRTTISRHLGQPHAVAWLRDSQRIVVGDSAGNDPKRPNRVLIWDALSRKLLKNYDNLPENNKLFLVTDDQQIVGFSDDQQVRIWNVETDACRTIPFGGVTVRSAFLIDQGKQLAVGCREGELQIRETVTGKLLQEFIGHTDTVQSVAISPDGQTLASGSRDRTVRLWDANTGRQLLSLQQTTQVNAVAFSPDGETLAVALHNGSIKQYHAPRIKPMFLDKPVQGN